MRCDLSMFAQITLHYRLRNMPPETSKPTSVASAATAVDEEQLQGTSYSFAYIFYPLFSPSSLPFMLNLLTRLSALESRLYQLLQKTPSSCGDDLLSTLRSIFSSTSSSSLSREDG